MRVARRERDQCLALECGPHRCFARLNFMANSQVPWESGRRDHREGGDESVDEIGPSAPARGFLHCRRRNADRDRDDVLYGNSTTSRGLPVFSPNVRTRMRRRVELLDQTIVTTQLVGWGRGIIEVLYWRLGHKGPFRRGG
jgi:hypothetical protein